MKTCRLIPVQCFNFMFKFTTGGGPTVMLSSPRATVVLYNSAVIE